jgi:lauroyl/myristoyl acyltransferase
MYNLVASQKMRLSNVIDAEDLRISAGLLLCLVVAILLPERKWAGFLRWLMRSKSVLRKSPKIDFDDALLALDSNFKTAELLREHSVSSWLEEIQVLKEYLPGDWKAPINLVGITHLKNSLKIGNGVILWTCSCRHGDLVIKKALSQAGLDFHHLRSSMHPYSATIFGMRVLNPIRTRIENRFVNNLVVLYPDKKTVAIKKVNSLLRKNEIVTITAVGAGESASNTPFLGGLLHIARGAIVISRRTLSPVHPVFITPNNDGRSFDVVIESNLEVSVEGDRSKVDSSVLEQYAGLLFHHLKQHPEIWRGWHARSLWSPVSRAKIDN